MKYTSYVAVAFFLITALLSGPVLKVQGQSENALQPIGKEAFQVMHHFFTYDKNIPLEAHVAGKTDETGYTREKIVIRSPSDNRVPGYLAIPKGGSPPYPCVLLLHGIGSSKESWWKPGNFNSGGNLTQQLLDANFAVMSLDAEYHGERLANNDFESPEVFTFEKGWFGRTRDMVVQSVVENMRAIDYLTTRRDIDTARIGVIGFSMGGMMTFNLAALEPRVKVAVASVTPILKDPFSPLAVQNFAPYIKDQPFLMLMGKQDVNNYSVAEAQKLHQYIPSASKKLVFFESGHQLPVDWTKQATAWMVNHLK